MKTIFDLPKKSAKKRFSGYGNRKRYYKLFPEKAPPEYYDPVLAEKAKTEGLVFGFCDTETTGVGPDAVIVSLAGKKCLVRNGEFILLEEIYVMIKPPFPMPEEASRKNHITDEMLANCPSEAEVFPRIRDFFADCYAFIAYNTPFDYRMLDAMYMRNGAEFRPEVKFDVMKMAVDLITVNQSFKKNLETIAGYVGIEQSEDDEFHNAMFDIETTIKVMEALMPYYDRLPPPPNESNLIVPEIRTHYFWTCPQKETRQWCVYITSCGKIHYDRFDRSLSVDDDALYQIDELNMTKFAEKVRRYHGLSRLEDLTFNLTEEWDKSKARAKAKKEKTETFY